MHFDKKKTNEIYEKHFNTWYSRLKFFKIFLDILEIFLSIEFWLTFIFIKINSGL